MVFFIFKFFFQSFQKQLEELRSIEERCNHMIINFPSNKDNFMESETQKYNQQYDVKEFRGTNSNNVTNMSMSPVSQWNDTYSPTETTLHHTIMSNNTMSATMMCQSLKCQAPKQVPDIPLLKSVDNNEMDSVPKY